MKTSIACCGLNCSECPTFIATRTDDDAKRDKVVAQWGKLFHMRLVREDINCDGCLSNTGRLFGHCLKCDIRKCCADKQIANCAPCPDWPCEKLATFYDFVPHARKGIERARKR